MESVLVQPLEQLQRWVNGHVIVETEKGSNAGTLLSLDYDGALVQGEIVTDDGKRVADIFIPWHRITAMAFTADEAKHTTPLAIGNQVATSLPEYVPGKDNWAGETR
jgi:hypothetical protein